MSQLFYLKWNDHMSNIVDACKKFLLTEEMADVTLACEGRRLKAHKFVLSACSSFFQSLLSENPCKHPIIILNGVRYSELKAVIQFVYHGEVKVTEDQLSALMKVAETLRIKGLTQLSDETHSTSNEVESLYNPTPMLNTSSKRAGIESRKRSRNNSRNKECFELKIKKPHFSKIDGIHCEVDAHGIQHSSISSPVLKDSVSFRTTNSFDKSYHQEKGRDKNNGETCPSEENIHTKLPLIPEKTQNGYDLLRRTEQSFIQDNLPNNKKTCDPRIKIPSYSETYRMPYEMMAHKTVYSPISSEEPMHDKSCPNTNPFYKSYRQGQQSFENVWDTAHTNGNIQASLAPEKPRSKYDLQRVKDGPLLQSSISSVVNRRRSINYTHHSEALLPKTTLSDNLVSPSQSCDGSLDIEPEALELGFSSSDVKGLLLDSNRDSATMETRLSDSSPSMLTQSVSQDIRFNGETSVTDARNNPLLLPEGSEKGKNSSTSKLFKCSSCPYSTSFSTNLKRHARIHTGEKPYACSICERKFSLNFNLKTHLRIHTPKKPYECSMCPKTYCTKIKLRKHALRHIQK